MPGLPGAEHPRVKAGQLGKGFRAQTGRQLCTCSGLLDCLKKKKAKEVGGLFGAEGWPVQALAKVVKAKFESDRLCPSLAFPDGKLELESPS